MKMPGFFWCGWMWLRDARGRWHRSVDAVGDVFAVLWVDVVEGRQRKAASLREWMKSGMFLRF